MNSNRCRGNALRNGTMIITIKGNLVEVKAIFSELGSHPEYLSATPRHGDVFRLRCGDGSALLLHDLHLHRPLVPWREAHLDYLRHLTESVETNRDIVEEAKVVRPLDRSSVSACRYTQHSQELLEYAIGTCPSGSQPRAKQLSHTPLIRKKQVTAIKPSNRLNSNKNKHVVAQKKFNHVSLNLLANEMMANVNVLGSGVLDVIATQSNGTPIITIEGNLVEVKTIVKEILTACHTKPEEPALARTWLS
nr:hypothetical protein [Tanacetum cinerariifolium]